MKPIGLGDFTRKKDETVPRTEITPKRGTGTTVGATLRLTLHNWERVHQLAQEKGTSINELAGVGPSWLFEEERLKP